jgi:leucyl-tRNA synthetase
MVLLAPAAPHITETLWHETGHAGSIHQQPWPNWDETLAQEEIIEIPVQVNGRVREVIPVAADSDELDATEAAFSNTKVQQHLAGREVLKVIYVPGKVLNIVTQEIEATGMDRQ